MSDDLTLMDANTGLMSHQEAINFRDECVWRKLKDVRVFEAIQFWLSGFRDNTRKTYLSGMNRLIELGIINPDMNLQAFSLVNHECVIDQIKLENEWSEPTRQARAACYISFTGFLTRRTQGLIKKAIPNKEGAHKTFFKYRDHVKTNALNQSQWLSFLSELKKLNFRDHLIAKLTLQGGKRISEVLGLKVDQINFYDRKIRFSQSKVKGKKETIIFYPKSVFDELEEHIGTRSGLAFITRTGKQVPHIQVYKSFKNASKRARLPFLVTPHVLRASTITYLKQQGFSDSDIMRISGHASAEMVNAYDKTPLEDNPSKKVNLVG